ncbi:PREDICTED: protein KRI1 homolog isoform X1 [Polistes canadensis]|uniref:protein KRI1 homolog isoform X1 n=2 Tax=Polistes canadensis TaxID=91411 RepID=UPI000718F138|nr:PREDICTED: protein KRI1 homolog isoform X1 [Polistes canadensis]
MSALFFDDNSDSEEEFQVNTDYAQNYDNFRKKEELNKLKTKYGVDLSTATSLGNEDEEESDSSSSSSEDDSEEGNQLNEKFDKEFYRTLAYLKKKDPLIYDKKTTFFHNIEDQVDEADQNGEEKKKKKDKTMFLRDYERKIITERDGKYSDSEDEIQIEQKKDPTYSEEQRLLKESFKKVLNDEDEDEDTELLKPKEKSHTEEQQEEESYKEWLKGQKTDIDPKEEEELKALRDFWNDPKLDSNEKFLRDYVLNHKSLNQESSDKDLNYNEMIHDSDEDLSEDENQINKQEEFEHKYNFRFEEPDQEFIKRYPRTMESTLRKKDTRRAQKRAELKKRKQEDKLRQKEELKQLKALKRKEIEEKIEKLREITGNDDIRFNDVDLEGDFDPAEHDKKMTEIFDEEYYAAPEDDMKPEFPDIDEELGVDKNWDDYDPNVDEIVDNNDYEYDAPHCEDPDFNMDADYNGTQNLQSELLEGTKKKKRRRRNKFAEIIAKDKPKFDPTSHPSYEEYFDQYYGLDYEDMIGDLPCRFKYRKVVPNDYGLTVEEILTADDKELNKWCSLKKALQYKPEHIEQNQVKEYQRKAQNEELKRKILRSLYAPEEPEELNESEPTTEETKKKRRRKKKNNSIASNDVMPTDTQSQDMKNNDNNSTETVINENLEKEEITNSSDKDEETTLINTTESKNNKKQKRKQKEHLNETESKKIKIDNTVNDETIENNKNTQENCIEKVDIDAKAEKKNVPCVSNKSNSNKKDNSHTKKTNKSKISKKKFNKNKKKDDPNSQIVAMDASRLKMYGINAKKLKNKLKYGKQK